MAFATGSASAQTKKPFDHAGLAKRALERHIQPGYSRLAQSATELLRAASQTCDKRGSSERKELEAAFDGFVEAWGRIEHIRFGPVTADNRLERILFWPDRRGIGARQVSRVLSRRDESVLDPAALAGKSVALQGLTALDAVLFQKDGKAPDDAADRAYRCRFAAAIAGNLDRMAHDVSNAWSKAGGYSRYWLHPAAGNPHFVLPTETTLALAKAYSEGSERVRDERVGGPLGLNADRRRIPAVLSRSGRTMLLIDANIVGLTDLVTEGGLKDAILATTYKDRNVDTAASLKIIVEELDRAHAVSRRFREHRHPFEDKQVAGRLIAMGFPLKNARAQLGNLLALTADIAFGFNSSDGD
ncbi:MAG: imelysin family protein [Hyphomicrobiaceae bacterium]